MTLVHLTQANAVAVLALNRCAQIFVEQGDEVIRLQYLFRYFADHDVIELVHRDTQSLAAKRAFLEACGAAVIAILPALAGVLDESGPAMTASGYSGEQRGGVNDARGHPFGSSALQQRLHRVEGLFVDDRGHHERHPFGRRSWATVAAVGAVEVVQSVIGGGGQDVVNAAGGESASSSEDAAFVKPCGDGFYAHWTPFGAGGQVEDHPHDPRFSLVNNQHLLVFVTSAFGDLNAVAIGRSRTIPEALTGVLQHCAVHVFCGLTGLMLVEDVQQLAEHLASRVLSDILRDRDQFYPGFT